MHIHMRRETWCAQARDLNLEHLCHVSLRVYVCKSEVINELACYVLSHNNNIDMNRMYD